MAFMPDFFLRIHDFDHHRRSLRSEQDWIEFVQKWFPTDSWPLKSPQQLSEESIRKAGPIELGGRSWVFTSWVYDLDPEARYEYFWTLVMVGHPLVFPNSGRPSSTDLTPPGWSQQCPYCEISTDERGDPTCPRCGRLLLWRYSGD